MSIEKRKYKNYDQYLKHQAKKLDVGISENVKKFRFSYFDNEVRSFTKRFEVFKDYIDGDNVLCLGARIGAEVKCLIDMGFEKSIGIDINPGKNNEYVIKGDFHNLDFEDDYFDTIYSNSIDHAWDLRKLSKEIGRVIKKGSHLILEIDHLLNKDDESRRELLKKESKYESVMYSDLDDIKKEFKEFEFVKKYISANDHFLVVIFKRV